MFKNRSPQAQTIISLLIVVTLTACMSSSANNAVVDETATSNVSPKPTTVADTRRLIGMLPADDIWWTSNGESMHFNNLNLARILPVAPVYRRGQVHTLGYALNTAIAQSEVISRGVTAPLQDFLDNPAITTTGVVVLRKGKIVFEHYPGQTPYQKPIMWSVTKVFVSAVMAILTDQGEIEPTNTVDHYLPEMADSAYAGITVRNLLDMATGLHCAEDYDDHNSCYYQLAAALGDGYYTDEDPDNPYEVLTKMDIKRVAPQGEQYHYASPHTFVLGWIVEKVTDMPFQDALTQHIWSKIGAEHDAGILAPRFGVPITYGGLTAALRDTARFGLLFTPSANVVSDGTVLPEGYTNRILAGSNPNLASPFFPGVRHSTEQWDIVFDNDDMYKGGWAGQGLLVNPRKDIVAVWAGHMNDEGRSVAMLPVLREILNRVYPDAELETDTN